MLLLISSNKNLVSEEENLLSLPCVKPCNKISGENEGSIKTVKMP
jgi:hypothetical protein